MSKSGRNVELLRQSDNDLKIQYKDLLCLRAKVASLLFPLQRSPARKPGMTRSGRSTARAPQRNARPASSLPILLLVPERHPA